MSTLCEEFKTTPREIRKNDVMELLRIMELRAYATAKNMIDNAKDETQVQGVSEYMKGLVFEIQHELYQERKARRMANTDTDDDGS